MGRTLDNFGFGLSIVVAMMFWQTFNVTDPIPSDSLVSENPISPSIVTAYTIVVFLTQMLIFGHLIFKKSSQTVVLVLRVCGWSLILFGYFFYLYLTQGLDIMALLQQPGGGINRF